MAITIDGDGTITGVSVGGLPDGIVDADMLAANAVTTAKISDSQITEAKLASDPQQGVAKMWINFNGTGTVAVRDSFNVASITDNGTGDYTISLTNAMPNNNYCVVASSGSTAGITLYNSSPQTGSVRIDSVNYTGSNEDNAQQHVAIFGD